MSAHPIRVSEAILLVEAAIADKTHEPLVIAMLTYFLDKLKSGFSPDIQLVSSGTFHGETLALYPVIAALSARYSKSEKTRRCDRTFRGLGT